MSNLGLGYTSDLRTPITHVGRVVQNARIDDYEYTSRKYPNNVHTHPNKTTVKWGGEQVLGNGELMHISRFSLLLKNKSDSFIANWNGDTDLRVFDCSNQMQSVIDASDPVLSLELTGAGISQKLWTLVALTEMEKLEFGGIAATDGSQVGYDPRSMGGEPREIVSQFGGLTTIINTGLDPIKAGDCVVWYLPRNNVTFFDGQPTQQKSKSQAFSRKNGLPGNKHTVGVRSLQEELSDEKFHNFCMSKLRAGNDYVTSNSGNGDQIRSKTVTEYHTRCMFPYHKVIGRAMSGAAPDKPFDILLGNYSA